MTEHLAPSKETVWKVVQIKQEDLEARLNKLAESGRILHCFLTQLNDGSMLVVFEIYPYK